MYVKLLYFCYGKAVVSLSLKCGLNRLASRDGVTGQLPPEILKTYLFLMYSNKLHHFVSPRRCQLFAALALDKKILSY